MTAGLDFDIGHAHIFNGKHLFIGGYTCVYIALRTFTLHTYFLFLVILASTHGDGVVQLTKHNILFPYLLAPSVAAAAAVA